MPLKSSSSSWEPKVLSDSQEKEPERPRTGTRLNSIVFDYNNKHQATASPTNWLQMSSDESARVSDNACRVSWLRAPAALIYVQLAPAWAHYQNSSRPQVARPSSGLDLVMFRRSASRVVPVHWPASLHCLSMRRHEFGPERTLFTSGGRASCSLSLSPELGSFAETPPSESVSRLFDRST